MAKAAKPKDSDREVLAYNPNDIPFGADGLSVPAIYADHIRGTMVSQGVVKLTLVENRLDSIAQELRAVPVATVIIPQPQLRAWATFLTRLADNSEMDQAAMTPPVKESDAAPRG